MAESLSARPQIRMFGFAEINLFLRSHLNLKCLSLFTIESPFQNCVRSDFLAAVLISSAVGALAV